MDQLPSKLELDARFMELQRQRDDALGLNVLRAGEIAVLRDRIDQLEKELEAAKPAAA